MKNQKKITRRNFLKISGLTPVVSQPSFLFRLFSSETDDSYFDFIFIRSVDLAVFKIKTFNLKRKGKCLQKRNINLPAYLEIEIPQQHISEEVACIVFDEEERRKSKVLSELIIDGKKDEVENTKSYISGFSRLVFELKMEIDKIRLESEELFNFENYNLITGKNILHELTQNEIIRQKDINLFINDYKIPTTYFEFPRNLFLSPTRTFPFDLNVERYTFSKNNAVALYYNHRVNKIRSTLIEPWNNELLYLKRGANELIKEDSRFKALGFVKSKGENVLPATGDLEEITNLTRNTDFQSQVIKAQRFGLSSLGATVALDFKNTEKENKSSLLGWNHNTRYGRDNYVTVSNRAIEGEFGLRVVVTRIAERIYHKGLSVLNFRYFLEFDEFEKEFNERNFPYTKIRALSKGQFISVYDLKGNSKSTDCDTKEILDPFVACKENGIGKGLKNSALATFRFEATDHSGKKHRIASKCIIIPWGKIEDSSTIENVNAFKKGNFEIFKIDKRNAEVAITDKYLETKDDGSESGEKKSINDNEILNVHYFLFTLYANSKVSDRKKKIFPSMELAYVNLPHLKGLYKADVHIQYAADYLTYGFYGNDATKSNRAKLFAKFVDIELDGDGGTERTLSIFDKKLGNPYSNKFGVLSKSLNQPSHISSLDNSLFVSDKNNESPETSFEKIESKFFDGLELFNGAIRFVDLLEDFIPLENSPINKVLKSIENVITEIKSFTDVIEDVLELELEAGKLLKNVNDNLKIPEITDIKSLWEVIETIPERIKAIDEALLKATELGDQKLSDIESQISEFDKKQSYEILHESGGSFSKQWNTMAYNLIKDNDDIEYSKLKLNSSINFKEYLFDLLFENDSGFFKKPGDLDNKFRRLIFQSTYRTLLGVVSDVAIENTELGDNGLELKEDKKHAIEVLVRKEFHGLLMGEQSIKANLFLDYIQKVHNEEKALWIEVNGEMSYGVRILDNVLKDFSPILNIGEPKIAFSSPSAADPLNGREKSKYTLGFELSDSLRELTTKLKVIDPSVDDQISDIFLDSYVNKTFSNNSETLKAKEILSSKENFDKNFTKKMLLDINRNSYESLAAVEIEQKTQNNIQLKKNYETLRKWVEEYSQSIGKVLKEKITSLESQILTKENAEQLNKLKSLYNKWLGFQNLTVESTFELTQIKPSYSNGIIRFERITFPPTTFRQHISAKVKSDFGSLNRPSQIGKLEVNSETSLTNFRLIFFKSIQVQFSKVGFIFGTNKKDDFEVKILKVEFKGYLSWISELAKKFETKSKNFNLDVNARGLSATYLIPLPNLTLGPIFFSNLKLNFGFNIPFVPKKQIGLSFGLNSPFNRFKVLAYGFPGNGFFYFTVTPKYGITELSFLLELGDRQEFDFLGIAKGIIQFRAGIYFFLSKELGKKEVDFKAYLIVEGKVKVLSIFSAHVYFHLILRYQEDEKRSIFYGEAVLRIKKKITPFFKIKVSIRLRKEFISPKNKDNIQASNSKNGNQRQSFGKQSVMPYAQLNSSNADSAANFKYNQLDYSLKEYFESFYTS